MLRQKQSITERQVDREREREREKVEKREREILRNYEKARIMLECQNYNVRVYVEMIRIIPSSSHP